VAQALETVMIGVETMKKSVILGFFSILILSFPFLSSGEQTKGIKVAVKDTSGRQVSLYKESHALLIGISNYTAGWPNLESVPGEINKVEAALKSRGFHVIKVMDPNSDELYEAFEDFIDTYGFDEGNRLFFFFSGHGHTRKGGKKGYLVPADAPDPRYDEKGFARKAIGMNQILTWSRVIEAKHALFLFDSCFSGTVFKAKALPQIPPDISDVTSRPVRQFISAGSAGEEVPASSVFTPSFIRALEGEGDLDKDGYITGTEMGMFLHKKVLSYRKGQTPQYGKIKDPDLDQGDFVFVSSGAVKNGPKPSETVPAAVNLPKSTIDKEMLFWQSIQDSDNPALFEAYIEAFPDGVFAPIAKAKVIALKKKQAAAISPKSSTSKLFVDALPEPSTIRILNIGPKFYQGMVLEPGRYHVEVSYPGYETRKSWIRLKAGENKNIKISLDPSKPSAISASKPGKTIQTKSKTTNWPEPAKKTYYTVLLSEDFSNNSRKWPVANDEKKEFRVTYGKYYFAHKRDKSGWYVSQNIKGFNAYKDFKIDANARHIKGITNNGFGIVWGIKDKNSFHFQISANGYFRLAKNVNGKFVNISGWKKSSKVIKGNNLNRLGVAKRGNILYCYVNGARVYQTAFEPFSGSRAGFRVDKNQAIEFDNFVVKVKR
jgi:hypothetical protein